MSWTTCFLIYFKTFWETYEHEMNINNIQLNKRGIEEHRFSNAYN